MIRLRRLVAVLAALATVATLAACSTGGGGDGDGADFDSSGSTIPSGCTGVETVVSPEKLDLLTQLADRFNRSAEARTGGRCTFVNVRRVASGSAAQLLADGWQDEAGNGARPTVWSPAASSWGAIVNQRLAAKGQAAIVPADARPFMLTPLVIAMPRPMAQALGWPDKPIGWGDLLLLARDPAGWGGKGHGEWGAFKLGKTNPNFSTSALSATIAQEYAATGKQRDLTLEDVARPEVEAFNRGVESAVVHYGDTTLTFLNNWYRNDARGTALTYVSAVAVEEKSVIDYNAGNPDGILAPGEQPKPPRVPLVAIYPKEGTLFSDNPFIVLDAPWVAPEQKEGARAFERFVQQPDNQREVLRSGFRPGNPQVAVGDPISTSKGVDPDQPQTTLGVPAPPVLDKLIANWNAQRKGARVLLVIDVSGSMGEPAGTGGQTKLDLAKDAAVQAIDQFKADDLVGLRIFTTDVTPDRDYLDLVPIGPLAAQRELLVGKIRDLIPQSGTPLYTVASASFRDLQSSYDASRINAVVLLTDGRNEDPENDNLEVMLRALRAGSEGQAVRPVRVFTIAYGADADLATLRRIADATNAAAYDASDPQSITNVFTAVISNF